MKIAHSVLTSFDFEGLEITDDTAGHELGSSLADLATRPGGTSGAGAGR